MSVNVTKQGSVHTDPKTKSNGFSSGNKHDQPCFKIAQRYGASNHVYFTDQPWMCTLKNTCTQTFMKQPPCQRWSEEETSLTSHTRQDLQPQKYENPSNYRTKDSRETFCQPPDWQVYGEPMSDIKGWGRRRLTDQLEVGKRCSQRAPVLNAIFKHSPRQKSGINHNIFQRTVFIISPAESKTWKDVIHTILKKINSTCGCSLLLSASRLQTRFQFLKGVFWNRFFFLNKSISYL